MVKITEKYLFRKFGHKPQIQTKKKGETDSEYLSRVTHLYLQSQFVDQIAPMTDCSSVTVVYLQNNQLQTIHNMENFPNLSHLYLQNNQISKIENLDRLNNLKKLYLGSNRISVLEGLDQLDNLLELHIENQSLPKGDTIYFEPRTMGNLARTLKVLNIARNNVGTVQGLSGMSQLEELIASDNKISDVRDALPTLPKLSKLALAGNPIASDRRYREAVILASPSVTLLDGKEITPETRAFVTNLEANRDSRARRGPKKSNSESRSRKETMSFTTSGSKLFPLLKMQMRNIPKTVSSFSANVSPHYFHQSLRAFSYAPNTY